MSVTFSPAIEVSPTQVACSCGAVRSEIVFASYQEAFKAFYVDAILSAPLCGDDFCAAYGVSMVEETEVPSVNFSNVNALEILNILGVQVGENPEERLYGQLEANDFFGRVLVAEAVQLADTGIPVTFQGSVTNFGRTEGYLNAAVSNLRSVAEYAVAHKVAVRWS